MSHIDIAVIKLSVMLHYIMLHYIMLHYIALHCIHYITYNNCKISLHKQFCFCKSFNFGPKCKSFGHHVSKERLHVWISSYPWLSMRTASIMRQWKLNKKSYIRMTSIHWITIKTCRKDLVKCIRCDCQWRTLPRYFQLSLKLIYFLEFQFASQSKALFKDFPVGVGAIH